MLGLPGRSRAEPEPVSEPTSAAASPREHYADGLARAEQGDYEGALDEFSLAYASRPLFAVLYNIGQAQVALGRPLDAIETLSKYLHQGGEKIWPERQHQVEAQILHLETLVARLDVASTPPGALVVVDGREIGQTPLAQPVKLVVGPHTVSTSSSAGTTFQRTVTLAEGEHRMLHIEFAQAPPPFVPAVSATKHPGALSQLSPNQDASQRVVHAQEQTVASLTAPSRLRSSLPYALTAAGLTLGGSALGVYLWNRQRYDDWKNGDAALKSDTPGSAAYQQQARSNNNLAASLATANHTILGLSIAGGTLLAAGGVLFYLDHRRVPRSTSALAIGFSDGMAKADWSYAW
jgi:tetratricopeptide (TPR) repeat protein